MWKKVKWALVLAGVPVVLAYLGCLDETNVPELAGPSELSQSLDMKAVPDQLTADGWSSSVIEVTYRNENGTRISGQTINFDLGARTTVGALGGVFQDLGNLAPVNGSRPVAGGTESRAVSAVTDSGGVARARYWAPFRTDQENDAVVTITARPAGTDYRAARFRQVDIKLRAANRPSFPGSSICNIIVEPQKSAYDVDELVFFTAGQLTGDETSCSGSAIARYEWDFGDGKTAEGRNTQNAFSSVNAYTVTLYTTEQFTGCQTSCTVPITVQ
jgi:hypothetical protein